MGTQLEYAINLLISSTSSSNISVHKNLKITGLDKFFCSMERMPEKHNIDFIKKTMQMHEDIFKHQVRELHRLYSVQRMLMDELKKEIRQNGEYWTAPMTNSEINCSQFINQPNTPTQTNCGFSFNVQSLRDDPSSRERSGSCSGETARLTRGFDLKGHADGMRGFDLETPADEGISTRIRPMDDNQAGPSCYVAQKSNKMSIDGSAEDSEVELTLSIGGSTSKNTPKNYQPLELDSPASFMSEQGENCSTPTTPMSSSSATFDQERKRPHWLFQGLSINRT